MPGSRLAGVLLHPTSLPGVGGIGTLGRPAHEFVDWLCENRFGLWQVLWQDDLDSIPGSNILSYGVDGKQYVAVVVGQMNNVVRDWKRTYNIFAPELNMPPIEWAEPQPAILVYSLDREVD